MNTEGRGEGGDVHRRRQRTVAAALAFGYGWMGAHKFYLGQVRRGALYLLACWTLVPLLVSWYEAYRYLTEDDATFQRRLRTGDAGSGRESGHGSRRPTAAAPAPAIADGAEHGSVTEDAVEQLDPVLDAGERPEVILPSVRVDVHPEDGATETRPDLACVITNERVLLADPGETTDPEASLPYLSIEAVRAGDALEIETEAETYQVAGSDPGDVTAAARRIEARRRAAVRQLHTAAAAATAGAAGANSL